MKKEIIINAAINEVRVAITEDGKLAEFYIELPEKVRYIGNVYYGKVSKIVPGINAAFIDIGLNQDAFLHFSDVDDNQESSFITEEDDETPVVINSTEIKNDVKNQEPLPTAEVEITKDEPQRKKKNKKKKKKKPATELAPTAETATTTEEKEEEFDEDLSAFAEEPFAIELLDSEDFELLEPEDMPQDSFYVGFDQVELVEEKPSHANPNKNKKNQQRHNNNRNRYEAKAEPKVAEESDEIITDIPLLDPENMPQDSFYVGFDQVELVEEKPSHANPNKNKKNQQRRNNNRNRYEAKAEPKVAEESDEIITDIPLLDPDMQADVAEITNENANPEPPKKKKYRGYFKKKRPNYKAMADTAVAERKEKYQSSNTKDTSKLAKFQTKRSGEITIDLEPGQKVMVQVIREAYASKGMKVTTKIAIPGRYTVLLPFDNMLGVSKKVHSYVERKRLRQLAKATLPAGYGGIIRTAAQGKSEDELRRDWNFLMETWKGVEEKVAKAQKPTLVYQDLGLANSVVRDLFNAEVEKLTVDSKKLYREIVQYLKINSPHLVDKVHLYQGEQSIFDSFGIERELAKTYRRNVSLPSGGDIVFDQTEAMMVVDVNSGRSKEEEQEKNALRTNLEAAYEIARQIRLRDVAGIILCDFIDLQQEQHKKKLYMEMRRFLSRDRAKTVAYPLTQLSLMQITRQRINQNIEEKTSEICTVCNGTGRILSKAFLINTIEKWLRNFRKKSREFKLLLYVNPQIATYLTEGTFSIMSRLMLKYFVKINVLQNDAMALDKFKFYSVRKEKDITSEYL